ncbi:hypothetical protein BH11MYX4_BH11MYX4_36380 [soil metagenome]
MLRAMVRPLRLETALPMIAALVAGCRSADSAPPLRPTEAPSCVGLNDGLLAAITLAPSKGHADYLDLREETASGPGASDGGLAPVVLGRAGIPCAGATDKPRCETTLRGLHAQKGFSERSENQMAPSLVVTYLVANFGDRFEVVATKDDLRALLAPIDTAGDVELVAGCGRMLKTASGWEVTKVFTGPGDCWGWTSGWQRLAVSADGAVTTQEDRSVNHPPTCIGGRRPQGLVEGVSERSQGTIAEFFVESAHLEAASVVAFERLTVELTERGAPAELIARARRSRDDETRHADVMEGFAKRLGSAPRVLAIAPRQPRSAFAMARENAVEGCIRETFGALVAHYEANAAESAEVRDAMRAIAKDETAHASLSWDITAWLEPRLSADEHRQLERARA